MTDEHPKWRSIFWDDLEERMKDPKFRRSYKWSHFKLKVYYRSWRIVHWKKAWEDRKVMRDE